MSLSTKRLEVISHCHIVDRAPDWGATDGGGMRRARGRRVSGPRAAAEKHIVRMLVEGCQNPAEVLELYYWSKEPGLLEIVRGMAMMTEETRSAIEAFVALASDAKSVAATLDPRGVLTLTS